MIPELWGMKCCEDWRTGIAGELDDLVVATIRGAVAEERARCAAIARQRYSEIGRRIANLIEGHDATGPARAAAIEGKA